MSVIGIPDFRAAMEGLPKLLKRKVLLDALLKAAVPVERSTKMAAPVLAKERLRTVHNRLPNTVRNAIMIRTSRRAKLRGNVGVFVNVKPLPGNTYNRHRVAVPNFKGGMKKRTIYTLKKKSARSKDNPLDPFYWRFLQLGTKKMAKRDFLGPGAARLPDALEIFKHELSARLDDIARSRGAIV